MFIFTDWICFHNFTLWFVFLSLFFFFFFFGRFGFCSPRLVVDGAISHSLLHLITAPIVIHSTVQLSRLTRRQRVDRDGRLGSRSQVWRELLFFCSQRPTASLRPDRQEEDLACPLCAQHQKKCWIHSLFCELHHLFNSLLHNHSN